MVLSGSSTTRNTSSVAALLLILLVVAKKNVRVDSFTTRGRNVPFRVRSSFRNNRSDSSFLNNSNRNENGDIELLKEIRERQRRKAILEKIFLPEDLPASDGDSSSSFVSLSLVGQAKLPLAGKVASYDEEKNKGIKNDAYATVLVVTIERDEIPCHLAEDKNARKPLPVLFLPLTAPTDSKLRLMSQVYAAKPISSFTNLIQWNLNLINRDDSLFDNIPWNQWSKDPDLKNRDSAGNLVDQKFRYGKRDAYNRFTGKDVNAKTVAASKRRYWENKLLLSLRKTKSGPDTGSSDDNDDEDDDFSFSQTFLSKRVLELRIQELRMEIAEVDSQLAISRTISRGSQESLEESRTELVKTLQEVEKNLNDLLLSLPRSSSSPNSIKKSGGINIIDEIAGWALNLSMSTRREQNEAPYRGATGYAPRLRDQDDDANIEFYRSPFDLLNEILSDQLNAEVIECVLENTSWLGGTIALGGAVVLQRRTPIIEKTLMGETLRTPDRDEDYGNFVKGGEIFVVECDVDEAIGVALSCDLPIRVEKSIFERSSMMGVEIEKRQTYGKEDSERNERNVAKKSIKENLPYWKASDSGISLTVEGDFGNPNSSRLSQLSIPRTTSSLFDTIFEPRRKNDDNGISSSSMFPTDNPIKSINQWNGLGDKDKAKTLLEISNFTGRLPRPRTVRNAPSNENPLDTLLLPLIDESVRNEVYIQDAVSRGDLDLANKLKAKRSKRQKMKEQIDAARKDGNEDQAEEWESEAEFLEGLRADVTQDEGSYSQFLDKDGWYERDRKRAAKRAKRSSFGTLLDGIE